MFTKQEKEFLRQLVKEKLKKFEHEAYEQIFTEQPPLLAAELRYDEFLKNLLKKLE